MSRARMLREALIGMLERKPTGVWGAGFGGAQGVVGGAAEASREGGDLREVLESALLGGALGASSGYFAGRFLPPGVGIGAAGVLGQINGRTGGGVMSMGYQPENAARRALRRAAQEGDVSESNLRRLVEEEGGDQRALDYALSQLR